MKVTSLSLWKWNGDNVEPTCLGKAEDVAEFGYFQRGSVRATVRSGTSCECCGAKPTTEKPTLVAWASVALQTLQPTV